MADELISPYIRRRDDGMLCIGDTKVFLDGVVQYFDNGESPESIAQAYRSVTLEQVYGAIAYYLGHRDEIHQYMRRNHEDFQRLRAENLEANRDLRERLLAYQRQREPAGSSK